MPKKNIFLFLLLGLFLISFASALEYDNVGRYNETTKTIIVKNSIFGIDWLSYNEIGAAQLNTPQDYVVTTGYQKVAEFDLWAYEDYNDVLKNLEFYDKNYEDWNKHKFTRNFDIKYKTITLVNEPIYNLSCVLDVCENITIGYQDIEVEDWIKVELADLKKNDRLTIGIFTDVEKGDYVEWIISIYGVEVIEWATFTEDSNATIWQGPANNPEKLGNIITVSEEIELISVLKDSGSDPTRVSIQTKYASDIIDSATFVGDNATFSSPITLETGVDYYVLFDDDGITNWAQRYSDATLQDPAAFPLVLGVSSVIAGVNQIGANDTKWLRAFQAIVLREIIAGTPPSVSLTSPANDSNLTSPNIDFITTVTDDLQIDNVTLFIDGIANETDTSGNNGTYTFSKILTEGVHNWSILAIDNQSLENQSETRIFNFTQPPIFIDLLSPADASTHEIPLVNMSCRAFIDEGVTQLNLTINGVVNISIVNTTVAENLTISQDVNFNEDNYTWGCSALNPSTSAVSANRTFEVLYSSPVINLFDPANAETILISNLNLTFNASDVNGLDNVTLFIDGVANETNSSGIGGNYSFFRTLVDGNYNWSVTATSVFGKVTNSTTRTFLVHTVAPVVDVFAPTGTLLSQNETGDSLTLTYNISEGDENSSEHFDDCWFEYGSANFCFQESLNVSNQTGLDGDCELNYTGNIFIDTNPAVSTGYFNYTKPINATSAIWQIRYGITNLINVTIPTSCYYADSETVILSIHQEFIFPNSYVVGNCYDGNNWIEIYRDHTGDGAGSFTSTTDFSIFNDGNYTTGGLFTSPIRVPFAGDLLNDTFYEEAIYWNIGTELNCTGNSANITYELGHDNLTVYAKDEFGFIASNTTSWDYLFEKFNITYETPVFEGSLNIFATEVRLKTGNTITQAIFEYNNTNYTTVILFSGGEYLVTASITAPVVSLDTNFSFGFYFVVSGITYFLNSQTQEVLNLDFAICGGISNDTLLNMSLFDEKTLVNLTGDIEFNADIISKSSSEIVETINGTFSGVHSGVICLSPVSSYDLYFIDAEIRYFDEGYVTEFYYIQKADLGEYPKDLGLYDLNQNDSTEFAVTYKNNAFIFIKDAVIQLQRKYIGEDVYRVVEAPLTSDGGKAILHIDLNTNKYQASVVKDGELLDFFENIVFNCDNELSGDCTYSLDGTVNPNNDIPITDLIDFSYSVSVDEDNQTITVLFAVPSGTPSSINVVLEQIDMFGNSTSCNTTIVTSAGSIECTYLDTIEKSILELSISKNEVGLVLLSYVNDPELDMDGINFFIVFMFMVSLVGMAIASPEWMIIISVMVLVISGTLLLIRGMNLVMGLGAIAWVIIAAGIIILKMSKQEDR